MKFIIYDKININPITKNEINNLSNLSFPEYKKQYGHDKDFFSLCKNDTCICILKNDDKIIGIAYLDIKRKNIIHPLSNKYLLLHSLSIHPDYRGKGYCKVLMKHIIQKFGNKYPISLTVCTNKNNPNIAGIKCYQRYGFKLIDMCHVDNYDGVNTYMIRSISKKKHKKSKKSKRSKRSKKVKKVKSKSKKRK